MHAAPLIWISLVASVWLGCAIACRYLVGKFRDDVVSDLAWFVSLIYARLVHRVRIEGREHVPRVEGAAANGPLVIVSNHTAGVDPMLIQLACPFEIRWMMMREMMLPEFSGLWAWLRVIPVEQNGRDSASLRAALRHLAAGGVLGIFAEGGIERPAERIMAYLPGVGMLVSKAKARVLPVVIHGTPKCASAYRGMFTPSRAVVRFLPVRSFEGSGMGPGEIALELEKQAVRELGWERG